ncbi:MAG: metal-dependent hydrolase [Bacillota bacterium]
MVAGTHVFAALAAAVSAGVTEPAALGVAAAGSLLPDLDCPGSLAGRFVPGSSLGRVGRLAAGALLGYLGWAKGDRVALACGVLLAVVGLLEHRGLLHSLAALGFAVWAVGRVAPGTGPALAVGWGSHLALDLLTPAGVPFLWPWGRRFSLPAVKTGSWADRFLGVLFLAAAAWLWFRRV